MKQLFKKKNFEFFTTFAQVIENQLTFFDEDDSNARNLKDLMKTIQYFFEYDERFRSDFDSNHNVKEFQQKELNVVNFFFYATDMRLTKKRKT